MYLGLSALALSEMKRTGQDSEHVVSRMESTLVREDILLTLFIIIWRWEFNYK